MFSISTVASSTRMPTASASPPSVITLSVSPKSVEHDDRDRGSRAGSRSRRSACCASSRGRAGSSAPVRPAAISRLAQHAADRRAHEQRLVEEQRRPSSSGGSVAMDRAAAASLHAAARCRASRRRRSSGSTAAPSAGRRRGPCWSAARSRRARGRRRACRPCVPFTVLIGSVVRGRRAPSGLLLSATWYSRAPIFAVPAGRITFWRAIAVEHVAAARGRWA